MDRRPRFSSGDTMEGENTQYYYDDDDEFLLPGETSEEDDPIVELGRNSPGSRLDDPWADPPVSYVPASWPTGPRELPPGRYTCPYKGCKHPVGPKESDEGYSRTTLRAHVARHSDYDSAYPSIYGLRRTVRERVRALRCALRRHPGDEADFVEYDRHEPDTLQRETDELILDLEEIRDWEESSRRGPYPVRVMTNDDRMRYTFFQPQKNKCELLEAAAAEEADDESSPHQNSNRFRNNRFRRPRDPFSGARRDEEEEGRHRSFVEMLESSSYFKDLAMDSDGSHGPPKKKARMSPPQLYGLCFELFPKGHEDPMELD